MKKMKIALVYDAIYPYIKGGGEKRFDEIGKRLAKKGHQVHLYGMKLWEGHDVIQKEGLYLHGICPPKPLYTKDGRRSMQQAIFFGIHCLKLIKEDFDVIDCCGFPYFSLFSCKLVSLIKRKKLFSTWHEVWGLKYWQEYLGRLSVFGHLIEKLSVLMPSIIISVSQSTARRIKDELGFKRKIYVISSGIDFNRIQQINAAQEKIDVIYAGRLMDFKHIDTLIKAIHLLKEQIPIVKCFVIGEGPEKKRLEVLVQKLNLKKNIKFLDFLENHDDVYALIKSSKVFVLPSTREGLGLVVIEANACGIPVVTINHKDNAAKDLVEEGKNGFIGEFNEKLLAEKILEALKIGKSIKQNCINEARRYDWDIIISKLEEAYRL